MGKRSKGKKRGRKARSKKVELLDDDWDEDTPVKKDTPSKSEKKVKDSSNLPESAPEEIPEAEEIEVISTPKDDPEEEEEEFEITTKRKGKRRKARKRKAEVEEDTSELDRPVKAHKKVEVEEDIPAEAEPVIEEEEEDIPAEEEPVVEEEEDIPAEAEPAIEEEEIDGLPLDDDLLGSVGDVSDIVDGLEEEIAQQEDSHALKRDVPGILRDVISQAWEDGVITSDEMALLHVLKKRFKLDDETFEKIMEEARPEGGEILDETQEEAPTDIEDKDKEDDDESVDSSNSRESIRSDTDESVDSSNLQDDLEEEEDDLDDEEIEDLEVDEDEDEDDDDLDDDLEDDDDLDDDEDDDLNEDKNEEDDWDNEDLDMMDLEQEILQDELDETAQPAMDIPMPPPPPPKPSTMITLTSSIRGRAPLGASFDLKQKETEGTKRSRCPKCKNQIAMHEGITRCPICSATLSTKEEISDGMRVLIDQARAAIKEGHKGKAKELLSIVLEKNPDNKEAQFFMRKVKAGTSKGGRTAGTQVDLRNVAKISTGVIRLDHLLNGGLSVGAQVMLKGPPFCGKDELFDQIMASALKAGFPVIYVSTNRAMKDVIQGIVKYIPNFKSFNREGKIWMYDLFSKHDTKKVLKEGHRIFNIEIPEDFKKFREDLIFVQEEAVKNYGGGLLIINSLSPLISQTEFNDLHKFLQMLIVRSKGYRFTNLVDVAHGIHDDSVINSVEYLMEGIIEFKEADSRNHLRLRGFGQKVASREWIEYSLTQDGLNLFGSFTQERIV